MERKILKFNEKEMRRIDDFRYASKEKQRFLVYSHLISPSDRIIKYETDEKLCYFRETLTPKCGTNGYIQRTTTDGFTFDKSTRKLKVWFGKKIIKMNSELLNAMFEDIGATWCVTMKSNLKMVATRMLFEKIFKGSIKSPAMYCESYIKYHLKVKDLDYLEYYSVILDGNISIGDLNAYLKYAVNPTDFVRNYQQYKFNSILDVNVLNACKVLGIKFDWSIPSEAMKEKKKELGKAIDKLRKEYQVVQEFYGYLKPVVPIPDGNLPF